METVVCLNWRNYLGRGDEYVEKLRNMVGRHLSYPHEFRVITEKDLPSDHGWWNKLALLRLGPAIYFDLDVVITGSIDFVVDAFRSNPERLWMRDDFSYSRVNPRKDIGPDMHATLAGPGTCNSSVMAFPRMEPPSRRDWPHAHGDQNVLTAWLWPNIGLLPNDQIASYKYHWLMAGKRSAVNVFHGRPKPHEVRDSWVLEHWR